MQIRLERQLSGMLARIRAGIIKNTVQISGRFSCWRAVCGLGIVVAVSALFVVAAPSAAVARDRSNLLLSCKMAQKATEDAVSSAVREQALSAQLQHQAVGLEEDDPQALAQLSADLNALEDGLKERSSRCTERSSNAAMVQVRDRLLDRAEQIGAHTKAVENSARLVRDLESQRKLQIARSALEMAVEEAKLIGNYSDALKLAGSQLAAYSTRADDGETVVASYTLLAKRLANDNLQAQVTALAKDTPVGISVVDLSTNRSIYEFNADRKFTAASTYKLFVAYSMATAVEAGRASWDGSLEESSLSECHEAMILYSDNECPQAWLMENGLAPIEQQVKALGATNTSLKDYDLETTAADMALFLTQLYRGELMNAVNTEHLLDLMTKQTYRDGIPSYLEPAVTVANKVGWLEDVHNDVGIVYGPSGDYALAIFTEQNDWQLVAELTRVIYAWIEAA